MIKLEKLFKELLLESINNNASDIHFTLKNQYLKIRFRVIMELLIVKKNIHRL